MTVFDNYQHTKHFPFLLRSDISVCVHMLKSPQQPPQDKEQFVSQVVNCFRVIYDPCSDYAV